jgi:imidazolonepropionase-like amidohydrolase
MTRLPFLPRQRLSACSLLFAAAVPAAILAARPASAQNEVPRVTGTYVIVGATIIPAPGERIENGSLVIRDGLIEAIGANIDVPIDAARIEADSLFVYPAFIDGLSHVGIPEPDDDDRPRPPDPGNPTFERAGIQPQLSAATLIEADDASITAHRNAGFAVAHVVPYGRMLPGTSAVASLGEDGPSFLKRDLLMYAQLRGAGGAYPGTVVGVMAEFRQLYREARRQQQWEADYAENPGGISHPPGEAVYEAFYPVIAGSRDVVFHVNSALEMQRVIRLKDDLGFAMTIAGAEQASEMISALAAADLPVILTVKLPEDDKKAKRDSAAKDTTDQEAAARDTTEQEAAEPDSVDWNQFFIARSDGDVDDERANLEARRALTRQRYTETAAALEKAGVAFGFTGIDVKPTEVLPNIRKMVEAGLSEEAALAALTLNSARILGIDRTTGTLERGKAANIVVADGPLFAKDTGLRFVFVDGQVTELEVDEKKNGNAD